MRVQCPLVTILPKLLSYFTSNDTSLTTSSPYDPLSITMGRAQSLVKTPGRSQCARLHGLLLVAMYCASIATARAQDTVTYYYTGASFNKTSCVSYYGLQYASTCAADGNLTGSVTFYSSTVPAGFTGSITVPQDYQSYSILASYTFSALGVTLTEKDSCFGARFTFQNGSIVQWDIGTLQNTQHAPGVCQQNNGGGQQVSISSQKRAVPAGLDWVAVYDVTAGDRPGDPQNQTLVASGMTLPNFGTWSLTPSPQVVLVDPVSSLLSGASITTDTNKLGSNGRSVRGVAADGTAQLVLRITGVTPGQQIQLTLPAAQPPADLQGALRQIGSTAEAQQITVVGQNTSPPMAFAVYRAPMDFSDGTSNTTTSERTLNIHVQAMGSTAVDAPVAIVRPPVILVHGRGDSDETWNDFPLLNDSRFYVRTVNYGVPVPANIVSVSPAYTNAQLAQAKTSDLGFAYNAPSVLKQIIKHIDAIKITKNVAAVQADIVAHSMGGNITSTLRFLTTFSRPDTFVKGSIHKVITIATPHLGTPLATTSLQSQNSCVADLLATHGSISLSTVTLSSGATITGAVGDLKGDGHGGGLSTALINLQSTFAIPFPTALVAGTMDQTNLNGLSCFVGRYGICIAEYIREHCATNPLATNLTVAGWPTILGQASDAVVPLTSQLRNTSPTSLAMQFVGVIHSTGMEQLDFVGPAELDQASQMSIQVIMLLNQFSAGNDFHKM